MSTPHDLIQQGEKALASVKHLTYSNQGWRRVRTNQSGVVLAVKNARRGYSGRGSVYRGQMIFEDFTPQAVFYVICNRYLWDRRYVDGDLIENLNETTSLTHEVIREDSSKLREYILIEKMECALDGSIFFAATSVDTPSIGHPRFQSSGRGGMGKHVRLFGWVLEPFSVDTMLGTRVTHYSQHDTLPFIPSFIRHKKYATQLALVVRAINEYLISHGDKFRASVQRTKEQSQEEQRRRALEEEENYGEKVEGGVRIIVPIMEETEKVASVETPTNEEIQPKEEVAAGSPEGSLQNDSLKQKSSVSIVDPISFVHSPKAPVQPQPFPDHSKALVRAFELLKSMTSSLDGWTPQTGRFERFVGVQSYSLKEEGMPLVIRSDGIVRGGWSIEQICAVIESFSVRKLWDGQFESGDIIAHINNRERLFHCQLSGVFPHGCCDVVGVMASTSRPSTNSTYIIQTSVQDPRLPSASASCPRLNVNLSGWVLRPIFNRVTGQADAVQITHVVQMGFGDITPPGMTKTLLRGVPSALDSMRRFINSVGPPPYARRVMGEMVAELYDLDTLEYELSFLVHQGLSRRTGVNKKHCTEIRLYRKMYPSGVNIMVTPEKGVLAESAPDLGGVRVMITDEQLHGQRVTIRVSPNSSEAVEKMRVKLEMLNAGLLRTRDKMVSMGSCKDIREMSQESPDRVSSASSVNELEENKNNPFLELINTGTKGLDERSVAGDTEAKQELDSPVSTGTARKTLCDRRRTAHTRITTTGLRAASYKTTDSCSSSLRSSPKDSLSSSSHHYIRPQSPPSPLSVSILLTPKSSFERHPSTESRQKSGRRVERSGRREKGLTTLETFSLEEKSERSLRNKDATEANKKKQAGGMTANLVHPEYPNPSLILPPSPCPSSMHQAECQGREGQESGSDTGNYHKSEEKYKTSSVSPPKGFVKSTGPVYELSPKGLQAARKNRPQDDKMLILSDDLTFNGQQLMLVLLGMTIAYYAGKLSCHPIA
ncbi:uncharacterized protein VTP21DRAFT_85 [Calcarisporiella thermophila]|uniref:uncharacterized protein n=1 Tax=Calcarisporiella thermophila TaxID=911321 RepID=UPI003742FFF6